MKYFAVLLAGFALNAATLRAQGNASSGVPQSHRPPPGMCRIWIDGVPPAHQPAPTDCATAIRKRPLNARVVFGSEESSATERGFAPAQQRPSTFVAPSTPSQSDQERSAQQQREEQEHARAAQEQRDAQERQRVEAQREHEEQAKREASRPPRSEEHSPRPPRTEEHNSPPPRPRSERRQRPPH